MTARVVWEKVDTRVKRINDQGQETFLHTGISLNRAKVPGGWILEMNNTLGFYPDPEYKWEEHQPD